MQIIINFKQINKFKIHINKKIVIIFKFKIIINLFKINKNILIIFINSFLIIN